VDADVIVVGARIAGSVLATLLGRLGHRALVLDRAQFPSDTLSTHFFRTPAFQAFERMGCLREVLDAAPRLTAYYSDLDGHVFTEPAEGPPESPFVLSERRITLDQILVRRASATENVTLAQRARVTDLIAEDGRVVGVRWSEGGRERQARARVVVGADGKGSFVASRVGSALEQEEPVRRAMYYAYFEGLEHRPRPAAEFHYRGDSLVYVFPSDEGLTLIAASVPIIEFPAFRRDPEGRLLAEIRRRDTLWPRAAEARRVGKVQGTGSIPGRKVRPYGAGWALVGDAGWVMDPWSGQGIDQASTHAVYLAEALHAHLSGEAEWETAMAGYHRRRDDFTSKTFDRTCRYARDLTVLTRGALMKRGLIPST
jgi:2-polyprenyl-6-methoxyphenol hydroxylase-like FAD-dependent oxidoreductase